MMLAEVYIRSAMLSQEISHHTKANQAFEATIKACDYAMHNASFGKGLQCSNSMSLASPDEVKDFISACVCQNNRKNAAPTTL